MVERESEGCSFRGLFSHNGEHKGRDSSREDDHFVFSYRPKIGKCASNTHIKKKKIRRKKTFYLFKEKDLYVVLLFMIMSSF